MKDLAHGRGGSPASSGSDPRSSGIAAVGDYSDSSPSYLSSIDHRLSEVIGDITTRQSPHDIFVQMRGAFPSLVKARLRLAARKRLTAVEEPPAKALEARLYNPELHPLNFEWYFTPDSAYSMVDLMRGHGTRVLCLGAPTVAAIAAQKGYDVTLVDCNPHIVERFPSLLRTRLWLVDVADAGRHLSRYDTVLFDAPWNVTDTNRWLSIAADLANPGAMIAFSLFPSLVRPTAVSERASVLKTSERIGDVSVCHETLAYETPVFESEALQAGGVSGFGNWRRGDLVVLRKRRPLPTLSSSTFGRHRNPTWQTFRIGSRIVKLRTSPTFHSPSGDLVSPVPGTKDFVFDSVSARDPRRDSVDLWTSRNRVARVADSRAVRVILQALENGDLVDAAVRTALPIASPAMHAEIERVLRCCLG